ncbi:MAG: phosphoenolpyruvate--protein phosphotransferase, partial [candidate division Zixibacteria bacterium]|nr:phosphoenolpyruvate--protein phosphotransferase [candidate division Zixibacteria bacterium]
LGVDEISTSSFVLPKVKRAIRSISLKQAKAIAKKALTFQTGEEVRRYLDAEIKKTAGELIEE